ncbi:MAG: DNA mismatch repair protein MutS, partial [Hyphomicrobiales bacterium]|nr:DNA mismatch repair protein MutS [Hyphomicrobiales bacterium]
MDSPPAPNDAAGATPMIAQYLEIKAANPDCLLFYRMGDFYELFFDDAEAASRTLGIALTKRGKHRGLDIPMCGVPVERADDYLQRLIARGHRVAVCEQMEDPALARKRGPKAVVRRDVTRLVTPGTITEERLLEPGRANLLVALASPRGDGAGLFGLAAVDVSTGALTLCEAALDALGAEIARLDPAEIVASDSLLADEAVRAALSVARAAPTAVGRDAPAPEAAARALAERYGVASLDGFGAFGGAELSAAGLLLRYVDRTQVAERPDLAPPRKRARGEGMEIDAATRANLELVRAQGGGAEGSLLAALDRTVTAPGARLLAERIAGPLADLAAISARHDAVGALAAARDARARLRKTLRAAPDGLRALGRLS